MKKFIKSLAILFVLFFGLAIFLLSNRVGGFRAFTVMSGSMEPAIDVGSLVITQYAHPASLEKGDVITFIRPSKEREFITHRIIDIKNKENLAIFKTKGDHNNSVDSWVLAGGGVVGKVVYSVPYLGYLLSFSKTKLGIALFILIPAFIIIYSEVTNIISLLKKRESASALATEGKLLSLLFALAVISSATVQPSRALLSDTVRLTGNKFTVVLAPHNSECGNNTSIEISNNAAESINNVNVSTNCTTIINQSTSTVINNIVESNTSTGSNQANNHTTSTSVISGSVQSNITVINSGGVNTIGKITPTPHLEP